MMQQVENQGFGILDPCIYGATSIPIWELLIPASMGLPRLPYGHSWSWERLVTVHNDMSDGYKGFLLWLLQEMQKQSQCVW